MTRIDEVNEIAAVPTFLGRYLPEPAHPVGYAVVIEECRLEVPLPTKLAAIRKSGSSAIDEQDNWLMFPPSYMFTQELRNQLIFALKYEGINLVVWKRLFMTLSTQEVSKMVSKHPTSGYGRRMWFLYEWLLGRQLDLPDATQGGYIPILDTEIQYGVSPGVRSARHRVYNNLPGTPDFCPLVFRTQRISGFGDLASKAQNLTADLPPELMARAAASLLLEDSKASYFIEGETPSPNRIQRWGQAIGQAGEHPLDLDELDRLQRLVLGKRSHLAMGIRGEGGFIGWHDRQTLQPIPAHISARPEDLPSLMKGLIEFSNRYVTAMDPIIAAAVLAFGFVYIHPFADGNGRLHRYLIHHVLAHTKFNPPNTIFPVSAVILSRVKEYHRVLASYSQELLPLIEWQETQQHNVHVVNDTADFYRYFDATGPVEFLYSCIQETIEKTVPAEIEFLQRYDVFKQGVENLVEMPGRRISLLFNFLRQNGGKMSQRAKNKEFASLSEEEILAIEAIYTKTSAPGNWHQQHNEGEDLQPT